MEFEAWTQRRSDRDRTRRLLSGYLIGALTVGGVGTALAISAKPPEFVTKQAEDIIDVQLAEEPEMPEQAEPEPEETEPQITADNTPPPAPNAPVLTVPDEIPDSALKEAEPSDNPYANFDPLLRSGQGTARAAAPRVVVKVATPAAAAPGNQAPARVTASTNPPTLLSAGSTVFPAAAKAAGIEGTVIVKYTVSASGNPENVVAVRGPAELMDACANSVRGSKFSPATDKATGNPIAVTKIKKCTFRLTSAG